MHSARGREYVKKPLNAFMLFMKEKRQRVIEECTLKESAAINQILGRKVTAAALGLGLCVYVYTSVCLRVYLLVTTMNPIKRVNGSRCRFKRELW